MKNLLIFCVLCLIPHFAFATKAESFNKLISDIWRYELSVHPMQATRHGVHQYNDRLADLSPQALALSDRQFRAFLTHLGEVNTKQLSHSEQITLQIQQRRLQNYIDQYRFKAHYMPIKSESGFHSALAFLPRTSPFKSQLDYRNYLARLAQFPSYFAQQIEWMKMGLKSGMVQPKIVLTGFTDSVKSFIHDSPQESLFYSPFKKLEQSGLSQSEQQELQQQAKSVIRKSVFTAYQAFHDFLLNDYLPGSKSDIAAKSWPNGLAYYQNRSDFYTTTNTSVEDIHQLGLTEVKRIRNAMQAVVDELNFTGDINQFIQFLRTDKQFYADSAEDLLKQAAYIAKKADGRLPRLFNKLPRTPYGVEPVPDNIAPKYTTGRYISPTRSDQPGYYWVNTYALDKRPLYALTALTLHEAVPGHHLQISLAKEMENLPEVRRYTYISAFGEGWGLYAEFLGKEVGMYTNLYDEFGRLSYEMWRACRLVVDTGMHLKGWSRQKARDYMLENTALSEHNIQTEVDRYISWPAQALSYKMGELTIKKLRKQAERELGHKFDLPAFHNAVLEHGSVPLSVLEANINLFIKKHK